MASPDRFDIRALLDALDDIAPRSAAASWDNPGLQVGEPSAALTGVMVALEADLSTLAAAKNAGANALCCHHPIIYRPVSCISSDDPVGSVLHAAASMGVSIIAAHTDLDSAAGGVNDALAAVLGLTDLKPLLPPESAATSAVPGSPGMTGLSRDYKLVVFAPKSHTQQLIGALSEAGAGRIGAYSHCSFRSEGTGSFLPDEGARPFSGSVGELNQEPEDRVEMIVPARRLTEVLTALASTHPYEEPAFDVYPLIDAHPADPALPAHPGAAREAVSGIGRIGVLEPPLQLGEALRRWCETLGIPAARVLGRADRTVSKVAICGGSASSVLPAAIKLGADVLVGGELSYHDWLTAEHHGIALVALGHDVSEAPVLLPWAERIREALSEKGCEAAVNVYDGPASPWRWVTV